MKIKQLIFIVLFQFVALLLVAQQHPYQWRIAVSGGYTNYYGDLSPYRIRGLSNMKALTQLYTYNPNYVNKASFQFSLERSISATLGIQLSGGSYNFAMHDRYQRSNGSYQSDAANFSRSLNVYTEVQDVGFAFVFKTDNDRFLGKDARIAPYFSVGAGLLQFKPMANLLDENNIRYDYSLVNIAYDNSYETDLRSLRTENTEYNTWSWYTGLSLGIRFRLSYKWDFAIHSDFRMTFTDYLDDVSGNYPQNYTSAQQYYAANPTQNNNLNGRPRGSDNNRDYYVFHGASLRFSFGHKRASFSVPPVRGYSLNEIDPNKPSMFDAFLLEEQKKSGIKADSSVAYQTWLTRVIINYTIIYPEDTAFKRMAVKQLFENQKSIDLLQLDIKSGNTNHKKELLDKQNEELDRQLALLKEDTNVTDSAFKELSKPYLKAQKAIKKSLDSLDKEIKVIDKEYDEVKNRVFVDTLKYRTQPDTIFYSKELDTLFNVNDFNRFHVYDNQSGISQTKVVEHEVNTGWQEEMIYLRRELAGSQRWRDSLLISLVAEKQTQSGEQVAKTKVKETTVHKTIDKTQTQQTGNNDELRQIRKDIADQNKLLTAILAAQGVDALRGGGNQTVVVQRDTLVTDSNTIQLQMQVDELQEELNKRDSVWMEKFGQVNDSMKATATNLDTVIESNLNKTEEPLDTLTGKPKKLDKAPEPLAFDSARFVVLSKDSLESILAAKQALREVEPKIVKEKEIVYFDVNSTELNSSTISILEKVNELMKKNSNMRLRLVGFADNTGDINYNLTLCEKRTLAVKNYFLSKGIDANRVEYSIGGQVIKGAQSLPNEKDRRVELYIETE